MSVMSKKIASLDDYRQHVMKYSNQNGIPAELARKVADNLRLEERDLPEPLTPDRDLWVKYGGPGGRRSEGRSVRVKYLYLDLKRVLNTARVVIDKGTTAITSPPWMLPWHLGMLVRDLWAEATFEFTEAEAITLYLLHKNYGFGTTVEENTLRADVESFVVKHELSVNMNLFHESNTRLADLGVVAIVAGKITLLERVHIKQ
jgi:hypothetical protein